MGRSRRPIVAGNWKMHTTLEEARTLARGIAYGVAHGGMAEGERVDIVLCPPFVNLEAVHEEIEGTRLYLGAQTMNAAARGAFTGEISWTMLQGLCTHVIVGHSERRRYYGESDRDVNGKVVAALGAGLVPIACVGEQREAHEAHEAVPFIEGQVRALLEGVAAAAAARVVIAYEPLWAVGTGSPATGEVAQSVAVLIRHLVRGLYGEEVAEAVRVQYGGSVTPANVDGFAAQADVDGVLIGGASLNPDSFSRIARAFAS